MKITLKRTILAALLLAALSPLVLSITVPSMMAPPNPRATDWRIAEADLYEFYDYLRNYQNQNGGRFPPDLNALQRATGYGSRRTPSAQADLFSRLQYPVYAELREQNIVAVLRSGSGDRLYLRADGVIVRHSSNPKE